jgi:hypothetical protein
MNPLRRAPPNQTVLGRIVEDSATAALRLLADLCRQFPALRVWLWEDFARNATVRDRFARMVKQPAAPAESANGFASLNGEDRPWQTERQRLRQNGHAARLYGGLTWAEMERLFRRYEAGTLDLGTFLLAHRWHETRKSGHVAPELMRASVAFLDAVTRDGDRRLLRHYYRALSFLRAYENVPDRRRALGYAEWWKLRLLLFMLRHPGPAYRIRDLRAHLASLGLTVSALDIRRFCTRHGIRRDMRAGRPRNGSREQAAD